MKEQLAAVLYLAKIQAAQTLLLQAGRPQLKASVQQLINRPHIEDSKAIYRTALKNSPADTPKNFEIRRMVCSAWKFLNEQQR